MTESFDIYMHAISQYPLLSAEQEKAYALRFAQGDQQARETMINSNLRLVVKIARRYSYRGLDLNDMIEEGNIGLMRAVEKFDLSFGCRFSTYATWWVRQAVERAIMNQSRTIRLPIHICKALNTMIRVSNHLRAELNREPSRAEIASYMGEKEAHIKDLQCANSVVTSADQSLNGDAGFTVHDVTEDTHAPAPDAVLNTHFRDDLLQQWMTILAEREHQIISLRFGLGGHDDPWTLEAIGAEMGVTRERIRQIQVAALQKLRCLLFKKQVSLEEVL